MIKLRRRNYSVNDDNDDDDDDDDDDDVRGGDGCDDDNDDDHGLYIILHCMILMIYEIYFVTSNLYIIIKYIIPS